MSLCEENCELVDYNDISKKVKCSCNVDLKVPENYVIKFNKNDFFKNFADFKSLTNLNIMKCYKTVLKIKEMKTNYGCIFITFIILFYFISLIIFYFYSFNKLKIHIDKIIFALKFPKEIQENNNNNICKNSNKDNNNKIEKKENKKRKKRKKKRKKVKEINKPADFQNPNEIIKDVIIYEKFLKNSKESSSKKIKREDSVDFKLTGKDKTQNEKTLELKDFEINSLDYEEAKVLDKRNFFEYYISSLKHNHPLSFSFAPFMDYNSKTIKIFLFFFSLSLDFTINALFFTDDTMHKIYEDKGKFNFLYQIPQILYSTIISKLIDSLIKTSALSQDDIIELKQEKKSFIVKYMKIKRKLKIKFILFFIIDFIILLFFWYYITCFCGIYVNTQNHLFKDSFLSFTTGLLYPFLIFLISGLFRNSALMVEMPKGKFLYQLSSFIENYLG